MRDRNGKGKNDIIQTICAGLGEKNLFAFPVIAGYNGE